MRFAKTVLLAGALSLAVRHSAAAGTIFVKSNASGANNGTSWANAYTSLQTALAAAVATDEIWVAAGTYKPTATADRTISFALKNGVGIYGGFAGTETMRSQRNPAANVTTLSGDIGMVGVATDNSYHVVTFDSTVTATGILDGFTLTAGRADGGGDPTDRGGAVYINQGSPVFNQCNFFNNYAGNRGAGVRVAAGSPSFTNSTFKGNVAESAGAGLSAASVGSLQVRSCVFRDNIVNIGGAAAAIEATDNVTVTNSVIAQNHPNGASFLGPNNTFINCTVDYNSFYGVIFYSNGNVIVNSIIWTVFLGASAGVSVTYSSVPGGFAGTGNNDTYPTYADAPADFRLASGSTGIDAGNNAAVPGGVTTDLAGLPRFFDDPGAANVGAGTPPLVDMGAYERVPLSVSAPANQTVCAGGSASFSVTASGAPPLSYRWRRNAANLSDGGSISGATTAMLTINPTTTGNSGSYDVVVTDGFAQTLASSTATLSVNATPAPVASNNGPICVGQTLQLSASTVAGASYSWTGPNAFTSSQQNPTIPSATVAASGTYGVTATVAGCASPVAMTNAVVNTSPSAVITAPSSVCPNSAGNSASVPDAGIGATYSWTIANGTITDGAGTRTITFVAGGSGTVMLNVTVQGGGCSSMGSNNVAVECPTSFFTLTPCRAVDTRDPDGAYGGPALAPGMQRTFVMAGRCGIPTSAKAVSVNVTVTQPGAPGHVLLYPAGFAAPMVSTINFRTGQTRANNAIVPLGFGGWLTVVSAAPTHFIIDVNGYFE
ncbi:MAG TPA: right-handed parallel beta-helix repeat-containing protein [Thermoanaerobaculia bacterium]|nr:right-handed parallel beta-helix repeat-containing protein [Thermoanaerobaculia bacterium]